MMPGSRIDRTFTRLHDQHRGGMVTYVTAGDPDAEMSAKILIALAEAGADLLEVGVPFSDPLADGPIIQRATERALAAGMTLRGTLDVVRTVRRAVDTPIVLFTYANPVVRMDADLFAREAKEAGVDGVLILDYPVEEAGPLRASLLAAGLDPIFLISPTTSDARIRRSGELGRGFLYVISRMGVTGVRDRLDGDVGGLVSRVRAQSGLPVALGFGISSPAQVAQACASADAAVVGSALVQVIADHGAAPDVAERAGEYVRWLKSAV
jgi:tryptophan synthase alpha chain